MKMKKAIVKQIKEMTGNFKPDMLPPCEPANVKFVVSPDLSSACQQFGKMYLQQSCISPEKCHATGKGLEVAKLGERLTAVLHIVDDERKAYTKPVKSLICELVSESTGEKIDCSVKKTAASGQYEISYQATSRGRHQLHIKMEGEHIKGSPFPVTVKLPVEKLGTPIKTISGVKFPWGVAFCSKGNIIVAEYGGHCISIFNPKGEEIKSFGSQGSGHGQFNNPEGVAVDDSDNILVADYENNRIQKFTSCGKFITAVKSKSPVGIAVHPQSQNVYVVSYSDRCIQILNPDLTFSSSFGSPGSGDGQFSSPYDVAFDSTGNVYVVNFFQDYIQVFTAKGQFLRKFGRPGSPQLTSICIDSEDVVYVAENINHCVSVFNCEGQFLTSFGSQGAGSGHFDRPRGIAVTKNGVVYVADSANNRLQSF
jgi:tripartite motif-containing protein 2/3/tripartite motif-containing protein 71